MLNDRTRRSHTPWGCALAATLVLGSSSLAGQGQPTPPASNQSPAKPSQTEPAPPRIEEHVTVTGRDSRADDPTVQRMEVSGVREAAGGFENVFQVLPLLPGVAPTNDEEGKLSVRGAGPEYNLVLFDGVAVPQYQRLGDFQTSFVNPETLRGLALDASGLDAAHGGRLSSTIILETRDGRTDRRLAASGSVAFTSGDVLLEGRFPGTRAGSWWATMRGTYYRLVSDRTGDEGMPGFGDVQFKMAFHPTRRTRLTVFGLAGRESMTSWISFPSPRPDVPEQKGIENEFNAKTRLAAARWTWSGSERVSSTTTLSAYRRDSLDAARVAPPWQVPYERNLGLIDVAGRQDVRVTLSGPASLRAGVDVHRIRSSWTMVGKRQTAWPTLGPNTAGGWPDGVLQTIDSRILRTQVGTWLQPRFEFGRIEFEPGLRVDWNSFTAQTELQPRMRVAARFGVATVWTGFSTQSQTPGHEAMEQGWAYYDLTGPEAGRLRNERVRQIVAGLERKLGTAVSLRAEAYYRRFDRLLTQRPETEQERQSRLQPFEIPPDMPADSSWLEYRLTPNPESTGRGRAAGIDLLVRRQGKRWSGSAAYSFSQSDRELQGITAPFEYERPHALSIAGVLQITRKIRLSATTQIASGFPITKLNPEVQFLQRTLLDGSVLHVPVRRLDGSLHLVASTGRLRLAERNGDRLPYYERTDVRATYSLGRWEFYGEVINLFDRKNFVYPIVEDGFKGQMDVYLSHEQIPSFGLRVRF